MRKFAVVTSLTFIVIAGSFVGAALYFKDKSSGVANSFNQINPFAEKKELYVKIDNSKAKAIDSGLYEYHLTSYSADGKSHKVQFIGMKKLKEGHYLRLKEVGKNVNKYEEVFSIDIPQSVKEKLK